MRKFLSLAIIFLALPLLAHAQPWNPYGLSSATGLPGGTLTDIIANIMYWLLFMLGIFGVIGFVISGILYLVSAGGETTI